MNAIALRRLAPLVLIPACLALGACDIVTADLRAQETSEWSKTYQLAPNGRVEIGNVNGKIEVRPSEGNTVEVHALKRAKGATSDSAKAALQRVTIADQASPSEVKIDTKVERGVGGLFNGGGVQVEYTVKVPATAEVRFTTVNGGIDITGLKGKITVETTNGGIRTHDVSGTLDASTTNGGLQIDLAQVPQGGVKLDCTNGGIRLRLPKDGKATISARIMNGGISTSDLSLDSTGETSRRRLDGKLNGGGPRIDIEGVNGGISIGSR
jgi:DUF4097 and DUF4098 domain-containing protein YvlB